MNLLDLYRCPQCQNTSTKYTTKPLFKEFLCTYVALVYVCGVDVEHQAQTLQCTVVQIGIHLDIFILGNWNSADGLL